MLVLLFFRKHNCNKIKQNFLQSADSQSAIYTSSCNITVAVLYKHSMPPLFTSKRIITMVLLLASPVYQFFAKFCGQCGIFTGDQNVWKVIKLIVLVLTINRTVSIKPLMLSPVPSAIVVFHISFWGTREEQLMQQWKLKNL